MTTTYAVNADNDLFLDQDGNIAMASGIEAVLQLCAHVAKTRLNEMMFDQGNGLPYFEAVWDGPPDFPRWEGAFRSQIMAVDGVVGIPSLYTWTEAGSFRYRAEILTSYGTGLLNG